MGKTKVDDSLNSLKIKVDSVETKVENVKTNVNASLNSVETKFDDMETKHVDKKMINLEIENHAKKLILKKVQIQSAKEEKRENEYPNIFLKFSSKNDIVSFTEKLNDIKKQE